MRFPTWQKMAANGEKQQGHRPGIYKQKNKGHKHGKHRTKGELERENKGRVSVTVLSKKQRREQRKMDRRHNANQLRRNKKDMVLTEKRRLGSKDGPPHLVAVVSLHARVNACSVTKLLRGENAGGIIYFMNQKTADLHSLLDIAKVADSLVFVLDSNEGWDSYGEYCLSCLFAQGLPSHALVCLDLTDLPMKKRVETKRALSKITEARFPDARLFSLDTEQEATLLLRHLGSQRQRKLGFRSRRSHLLGQSITFTPNSEGNTGLGTLCVSGYVRGCPLSVDRLVHISGHGDFQLSQIDAPSDPLPLNISRVTKPGKGGDVDMIDGGTEETTRVLMIADPTRRESLQAEAEVDPMDGEQTWPTEAELLEAEEVRKNKRVMKVPKGTSDYQATWIVDEEEDNGDIDEVSSDEDDDDDDMMDEAMEGDEDLHSQEPASSCASDEEDAEDEEEVCPSERAGADQEYDANMDKAAEEQGLQRYREARANEMFPDEVDTPLDTPARIRFQRYRGLKSFRASPWDPMENLPPDYSRIFQFQSLNALAGAS
ncbi:hypothetical protein WMY93_029294 [Mugilogobius chulae]|uniref:Pre-rRNA-processing protein TSR1 homolog n=1 Tax=Mugilogobius chulae TaxID=88201 RepID=A0AAW0MU47_9GOBI